MICTTSPARSRRVVRCSGGVGVVAAAASAIEDSIHDTRPAVPPTSRDAWPCSSSATWLRSVIRRSPSASVSSRSASLVPALRCWKAAATPSASRTWRQRCRSTWSPPLPPRRPWPPRPGSTPAGRSSPPAVPGRAWDGRSNARSRCPHSRAARDVMTLPTPFTTDGIAASTRWRWTSDACRRVRTSTATSCGPSGRPSMVPGPHSRSAVLRATSAARRRPHAGRRCPCPYFVRRTGASSGTIRNRSAVRRDRPAWRRGAPGPPAR